MRREENREDRFKVGDKVSVRMAFEDHQPYITFVQGVTSKSFIVDGLAFCRVSHTTSNGEMMIVRTSQDSKVSAPKMKESTAKLIELTPREKVLLSVLLSREREIVLTCLPYDCSNASAISAIDRLARKLGLDDE